MVAQKADVSGSRGGLLDRRTLLALAGSATIAGILGAGGATASQSLPRTLVLDARGRSEPCGYAVEVTDEVSVVPTAENAVASTATTTVEGTVTDGVAGFHYAGDLVGLTIDGGADVLFGDDAAAMPAPSHRLTITAPDEVSYEFTTTGPASKVLDDSDVSAESGNDAVTDNADGTATVSGYTGNGYGDSYLYEGSVESFSAEGDHTLTVDGTETTAAELTGDEPDSGSGGSDDLAHELVVRSEDGSLQAYAVTVEGTARTGASADTHDHEYRDRVVDNGDGTVTITGWVRDQPDAYPFEGTVTGIEAADAVGFALDGTDVARSELVEGSGDGGSGSGDDGAGSGETHQLGVRSTDGSTQEYAVTVDGTATPGSSANTHDHEYQDRVVDEGDGTVTISGWVASASDDYTFGGTVTGVEAGDPVAFTLDGSDVARSELVEGSDDGGSGGDGSDGASATGNAVGGGDAYGSTVSPDAATVTVSTRSELSSALSNASAGDVVYLAGDADIDAGTETFTVPAGVTLASDRGVDGAPGGRLYTTQLHDDHYGMVRAERNARVTGLRVDGPIDPDGWTSHSYDYEITGIYATDLGVEVDNVEVYGWGYACVYTDDDTHVHHSEIHHANVDGIGYGVMANASENPIVEYNHFSHNRHSVATSGGGGYTARYNLVEAPANAHVFDQHRPGGTTTKIYNNTVAVVDHDTKSKNAPAVAIRGVPDDTADVYNNWFHNPKEPRATPDDWTDEAIIQVHTDSWQNVEFWGNHYGSGEPSSDVGAPR